MFLIVGKLLSQKQDFGGQSRTRAGNGLHEAKAVSEQFRQRGETKRRSRQGERWKRNMQAQVRTHGGKLAVIECLGRIVRSEAAVKVREAATSKAPASACFASYKPKGERRSNAKHFLKCFPMLSASVMQVGMSSQLLLLSSAGERYRPG